MKSRFTKDEFNANPLMAIGLISAIISAYLFIDAEGILYTVGIRIVFIGLILAVIGIALEYHRLLRIKRNRERRAIQRTLDRERRGA